MTEPLAEIDPNCPGCRALLALIEHIRAEHDLLREAQQRQIAALETRVQQLEEQLGQDSGNSDRPPSSDSPKAREARGSRARSGRARGGQKGHKGSRRDLLPPDAVDHVVPLIPTVCGCCGEPLSGIDSDPRRHQVTELPPVRPTVTEYQQHTLPCTTCGATTTAALPDGVPTGAFGPRLSALICTLTVHYRLAKQKVQELLADVLGVSISTGGISRVEARMSDAVAEPVSSALAHVRQQDVAYIDETSWFEGASPYWLWAVVTEFVVVFVIRKSRGRTVAKELLGCVPQLVAVSDRYGVYKWLDAYLHQLCWSHIKRDFNKMARARDPAASALGEALLSEERQLFVKWHQHKAGHLARSSLQTQVSALRGRVWALLEEGAGLSHKSTAGTCRELMRTFASMWTFVRVDGVEPTNNDAERNLRHGVQYRKTSYGTASARGSRYVERMLTVRATLRRQGRNVFAFLAATADAANHHTPGPSLLPDQPLTA